MGEKGRTPTFSCGCTVDSDRPCPYCSDPASGRVPTCATCEAVARHPHLRCEDHPFAGRVPSSEPCKPCRGTGLFRAYNEPPDDCLTCGGTGWVSGRVSS